MALVGRRWKNLGNFGGEGNQRPAPTATTTTTTPHHAILPAYTRQDGSRTPEEEEQVVYPQAAPQAALQEEDSAESYHSRQLVLSPTLTFSTTFSLINTF